MTEFGLSKEEIVSQVHVEVITPEQILEKLNAVKAKLRRYCDAAEITWDELYDMDANYELPAAIQGYFDEFQRLLYLKGA